MQGMQGAHQCLADLACLRLAMASCNEAADGGKVGFRLTVENLVEYRVHDGSRDRLDIIIGLGCNDDILGGQGGVCRRGFLIYRRLLQLGKLQVIQGAGTRQGIGLRL